MTIEQKFVEFIAKNLVNDKDAVKVDRVIDEKGVLLTLYVADEDLGRAIGRNGTTAQALRTLLRVLGNKNEARYTLKIYDGKDEVDSSRPDERPVSQLDEDIPSQLDDDVAEDSQPEPEVESSVDQVKSELDELDDIDV